MLLNGLANSLLSARVYYASKNGCVLDGVTDDTAAIQRMLNVAQLWPIHVILDGNTSVTHDNSGGITGAWGCLRMYTDTALENWGTMTMAADTNAPMLINANPTGGTITDQNITLIGGTYDHNAVLRWLNPDHSLFEYDVTQAHDVTVNGVNRWVRAMIFYGVKNLTIKGISITNNATFALNLVNVFDVNIDGCSIGTPQWPQPLDPFWASIGFENTLNSNTDGIHLNGPFARIHVSNCTLWGGDDPLALNVDDGNYDDTMGTPASFSPNVIIYGDGSEVQVESCNVWGGSFPRVLSGVSAIDNIEFSNNISHSGAINIAAFGCGRGNIGSLVFRNHKFDELSDQGGISLLLIQDYVRSLVLQGSVRSPISGSLNSSVMPISPNGFIENLILDLELMEDKYQNANCIISSQGHIENAQLRVLWKTPTGGFRSTDSIIKTMGNGSFGCVRLSPDSIGPALVGSGCNVADAATSFSGRLTQPASTTYADTTFSGSTGVDVRTIKPVYGNFLYCFNGAVTLDSSNRAVVTSADSSHIPTIQQNGGYPNVKTTVVGQFTTGNQISVLARASLVGYNDSTINKLTFVRVDVNATTVTISQQVCPGTNSEAAVITTLGTGSVSLTAGVNLTGVITTKGNQVSVQVNGGTTIGPFTITNADCLTNTGVGLSVNTGGTAKYTSLKVEAAP